MMTCITVRICVSIVCYTRCCVHSGSIGYDSPLPSPRCHFSHRSGYHPSILIYTGDVHISHSHVAHPTRSRPQYQDANVQRGRILPLISAANTAFEMIPTLRKIP